MAGHLADEVRTAWTCAKQLTHYPSFSRNGTTITLYSFTIITVEKESQYPGYLEDFYENKKGQKRVKVRCFEHFQEVHCVIPKLEDHLEKYLHVSCSAKFKNSKVMPFSLSELEG